MVITSILFSVASKADFVDIGYNEGLAVETAFEVDNSIYITASYGLRGSLYGVGAAYNINRLSVLLTFGQYVGIDKAYKTELSLNYHDVHYSYFASVSSLTNDGVGYRVGAGWALNENVNLIGYYSDGGLFVGIRRYF